MVSTGVKHDENHQVAFWRNGKVLCDTKRKRFQCLHMF